MRLAKNVRYFKGRVFNNAREKKIVKKERWEFKEERKMRTSTQINFLMTNWIVSKSDLFRFYFFFLVKKILINYASYPGFFYIFLTSFFFNRNVVEAII